MTPNQIERPEEPKLSVWPGLSGRHDNKPPVSDTPESLLSRTARGGQVVMAWRLGMRVFGLASTLVLVHLTRPAAFGIIALASRFMQTLDGMLTLVPDRREVPVAKRSCFVA